MIRTFFGLSDKPGTTWAGQARAISLRLLRAVAIGYVVTAVLLYGLQSRMLYFPQAEIEADPGDIHLDYEEASFSATDDVKVSAWWVPAADAKATILFCHGNAGNISHRLGTLAVFNRLGLNTLIFDYRGYGRSGGKPTEEGTYLDAKAAWDHLTEQRGIPPEQIVIYGRSLGGAIAAHLATNVSPAGLIVDSSFTSVPDRASEMLPIFPIRFLCRFSYDTRSFLEQARCPVMIIHSRDDEMMSFEHGLQLFEAAGEPKELVERFGGHNDGFSTSPSQTLAKLSDFICEAVDTCGMED